MVNAIKICSLGVCTHHGKNGLGICTQKVIAKEVDDVYRGDTARGVGKLQSLWVGINIDNVVCKTVWVGGIVEWGVEAENALYKGCRCRCRECNIFRALGLCTQNKQQWKLGLNMVSGPCITLKMAVWG